MNANRIAAIGLIALNLPAASLVRAQYTANYQTNIISGVRSNWAGNYLVGSNTFADVLLIQNSGVLSNRVAYLGYATNSSNNGVLVSGSGSVWSNYGDLYAGYAGAGNGLVISNSGRVLNDYGYVGWYSSSSNNTVFVTGTGSVWSNRGALFFGNSGGANSLVISNGGRVIDVYASMGYDSSSRDNTALITGAGSVWSNPYSLWMGDSGAGNRLVIRNGGQLYSASGQDRYSFVGSMVSSSNNYVLVTDTGSAWRTHGWIYVGVFGSGNSLVISNGGQVVVEDLSSGGYVGTYSSSRNNSVRVVDGGVWRTGILRIGDQGSANSLVVAGGSVLATNLTIGFASAACDNIVQVDSGSVVVTNGTYNAVLEVRRGQLILNGGVVQVDRLVMTNSCALFVHNGGTLIVSTPVLDPALDADSDGMPNGWEQSHGLDPLNPADAGWDADGDGQTNLAEFLAGTDPISNASALRIVTIARVGADVWVDFTSVIGKYYSLQRCDSMGGPWTNVVDSIPGNDVVQWVKDIGAASRSMAFYRLRLNEGSSPPPDSDDDGIADWWTHQYFGHPTGQEADQSRAADDADGDGMMNLEEFLSGTDPTQVDEPPQMIVNNGNPYTTSRTVWIVPSSTSYPNILASIDPGMANATVLPNSGGPISYSLPDADGSYHLYLQYADAEGQPHSAVVAASIRLDRLPPVVQIASPVSDAVLDQAFITLQAVAADPDPIEPTGARALKIWLNDEPFWSRDGTNIVVERFPVPLGTNAFTVIVRAADEAGHTNQSSRTWTVDPSGDTVAPHLTNFNIAMTTLLPDVGGVWLECTADDSNAVINAMVSADGGAATTNSLSVRGTHVEGLVPLEFGTNAVVVRASDAAGNATSNVFTVIRSDRYRFEITSPAFGEFATAPTNYVSGYVSAKFDEGLPTETNVTSVLINGVAAALGTNVDADGNLSFTTTNAIPLGVPITGFIAGPGIPTNPPPDPPVSSQEYEVTAKTKVEDSVVFEPELPSAYRPESPCGNNWRVWVNNEVVTNECTVSGQSVSMAVYKRSREAAGTCSADPANDPSIWGSWGVYQFLSNSTDTARGLAFGTSLPRGSFWPSSYDGWAYMRCGGGGEHWFPWENKTLASVTFRAPRQYDTNTTVIFTFEGMDYARPEGVPLDLSQVEYQGQSPIAWSNEVKSVSYLITVDGGRPYTISQDSFRWPSFPTNSVRQEFDCIVYFSDTRHWLSWTNFHNVKPEIERRVIKGPCPSCLPPTWTWGQGPWPWWEHMQGSDTYPTDKSVNVWVKITGPNACNTLCCSGIPYPDAGATIVRYTNFPAGTTWRFDVSVSMSATGTGSTGAANVRLLGPNGDPAFPQGFGSATHPYSMSTNLTYTVTIDSSGGGPLVTYDPSIGISGSGDTGEATVSIAVDFVSIQ